MSERVVSRWEDLLALALPALDFVFGASVDESKPPVWTLGGGTAIALRLGHRISHDVDIFVPGVPLKLFTPAQNSAAKAIWMRFQWPGHDLKFERPEGQIDFLSPALQTDPGYSWAQFRGRRFALETAEEVIVKKIRYRSARFTERDLYDLAVVAQALPGLPHVLAAEVPDALDHVHVFGWNSSKDMNVIDSNMIEHDVVRKPVPTFRHHALARVRERVALHHKTGVDALRHAIIETPSYRDFAPLAFDIAARTLDATEAIIRARGDG